MREKNKKTFKGVAVILLALTILGGCGKNNDVSELPESVMEDVVVEAVESADVNASSENIVSNDVVEAVVEVEEEKEVISEPKEEIRELGTFIVYFSGIDVWGWTDITSRSDVNILAAVNTNSRHIQLVNTPRDYYVTMPISEDAKDKLTHAGIYGIDNSIGALENLYGIDIDYYLRLNFSGFEATIDAMGGIDVYSEYDFTVDPIKDYVKGYNHLTGLEALAFVRERHAFASGDRQRGRNQMALVQAMVKKVCSKDFLDNREEIMNNLTDMYRTSMPNELVTSLIFNQILDNSEWTVDTFSVSGSDGSEATYSSPGAKHYVMIPNMDDVAEATKLINAVLQEN